MATSTNLLLTAVKTLLSSTLPAQVTTEGLPAIDTFLEFEPILREADKLPLVWVEWDRSRKNTDTDRGRTIRHYSNDRVVQVGIAYKHTSPLTCARTLRSYCDLIRVCLEADMILSNNRPPTSSIVGVAPHQATWLLWLDTDPSPPFVLTGGEVYRQAVLSFDIPRRVEIGED